MKTFLITLFLCLPFPAIAKDILENPRILSILRDEPLPKSFTNTRLAEPDLTSQMFTLDLGGDLESGFLRGSYAWDQGFYVNFGVAATLASPWQKASHKTAELASFLYKQVNLIKQLSYQLALGVAIKDQLLQNKHFVTQSAFARGALAFQMLDKVSFKYEQSLYAKENDFQVRDAKSSVPYTYEYALFIAYQI